LVVLLAALLGLAGALALPLVLHNTAFNKQGNRDQALASPLDPNTVYLPLQTSSRVQRRVNLPYFPTSAAPEVSSGIVPTETAIFWLGRVNQAENYADIRVAYDDRIIHLYMSVYDRLVWYQNPPRTPSNLLERDAVTLYLNLAGGGSTPSLGAYRFDAGVNRSGDREAYQVVYQGNGATWVQTDLVFTTTVGLVGEPNDSEIDRGWTIVFRIPFSSLGLSGPPPQGSIWGAAMALYDSDNGSGPPIADNTWPENLNGNKPSTWGAFHFGLPGGGAQPGAPDGTTVIRQGLNGAVVTDGGVGGNLPSRSDGSALCNGNPDVIWNIWATRVFPGSDSVNIQNQLNLADWPCFAKYYLTFPLDGLPEGKSILSADLTLHQWGGSDLTRAQPSLLQISTLAEDWSEASLSWNSAPIASENVSQVWTDPYTIVTPQDWPGKAVTWDISRAVRQAVLANEPLRLAIYSADAARHSGKYFITSDEPFFVEGRPTLTIEWTDP
jgi:hypothetical protein